jgi:NAD(P)-dependent dehydrogenase (short-subunit alcohol dehydrogenase family)
MLLTNRVAIITGGARGIGKGIALKFAEEGCSPVITDVLDSEGQKALDEISRKGTDGLFIRCDVSDSRQVQDMLDQVIGKFGKVDILVNNAGISGGNPRSILEVSEEVWDRVLGINLKGAFLCAKAVVPSMKEKGYGKIINIASMAAIAPPAPLIHYSSAKAGMLGFTMDLALELAPFNICVNAILPGAIRTEIWDELIPPGVDKDLFFTEVARTIAPMARIGTPEDIAGAAVYLASNLSSYVTGDRLIVAGGAPLIARIKF